MRKLPAVLTEVVTAVPTKVVPAAVAFGPEPAARMAAPGDPLDRWYRAVALGALGRYAAAAAELDSLDRAARPRFALRSLVASTRASQLRQLGWHRAAASIDGRALAFAAAAAADPLAGFARCDALTGLAADALGQGRLDLADTLLARVPPALPHSELSGAWRPRVRLHWVTAEVALARGAATALEHATAAYELAARTPSTRHRIKSRLLVAAANCVSGHLDEALEGARTVLAECDRHGLTPLRWAAGKLAAGLGDETAESIAAECAHVIERRGGRFAIR